MYRHYLLGRKFIVRTDHHSSIWLLSFRCPQDQSACWLEELSQYHMVIQHRPGRRHCNADALPRLPVPPGFCGTRLEVHPSDLPCGGCPKCTKAHDNWNAFAEEVDDVGPLSKPCCWSYNPDMGECQDPQTSEAVAVGEEAGVDQAEESATREPSVTCEPSFSEVALGYVSGGLLGRHGRSTPRELNFEEPGCQEGPFRTQLRLNRHSMYVCVLGSDPEASEEGEMEPEEGELFLASPAVKNYHINRNLFFLDDHKVLWKKSGEEGEKRFLVVPRELRQEVLRLCHDVPAAGHQAIDRTKARINDRFCWYGMSRDAENYVSTCGLCSRNKRPQCHARAKMFKYHAGAPMERVHLDFLGPLPRTARGNEYVLVMVNQFTKWVECIPLPSQTAEVTATAAVNEFFSRFGCPFQIFTDQGRNFESKLFRAVCELLQVHKARTTPYRPSANGQGERYNCTLMDAVQCYVDKAQNCWDEHLAQIAGALRSAVKPEFRFNKLMLRWEVNTPADLPYPAPRLGDTMDLEAYVVDLEQALQTAHETARGRLRTSEERMKRDYDLKVHSRAYEEGDLVYILDTATVKGRCR
uniref:Uncharacterized protein LOC111114176 n=1 Tax=Crassostrea virginica TaxID=6565 RepID=A0A8B8BZA7_CRAVI|nr:uncharacterized protein LOC111114176 [Crassostrea virginica]